MLQLVPILQMQKALRDIRPLINDASRFGGLLEALTTGPFELVEFKRIFNAYADNIYYVAGSPEANLYMLGGATPSTKQTTQCPRRLPAASPPPPPPAVLPLLPDDTRAHTRTHRPDPPSHPPTHPPTHPAEQPYRDPARHPPLPRATDADLLRNEAIKQLGEVADELRYQLKQPLEKRETDVALEYMQNLLATFDEYLSYTPKQELETARSAVYSRST